MSDFAQTRADARISAIIPTLCSAARVACLDRAIESLKNASADSVQIIVVVNGNRFDVDAVANLRARCDVRVIQIAEAGAPQAQRAGRYSVDTEFFCFLDDDDELLPGALDRRLSVLHGCPEAALSISRGWRVLGGVRKLMLEGIEKVPEDPLGALFDENWLPSCGGLFRTSLVDCGMFDDPNPFIEWTWLAFRMACAGLEVAVQPAPDFLIHETPGSASKSEAYMLAHTSLFERMLLVCPREDIRKILENRWVGAAHGTSDFYRQKGNVSQAWVWHLRSLRSRQGWCFASYSARLLPLMFASFFSRRRRNHE